MAQVQRLLGLLLAIVFSVAVFVSAAIVLAGVVVTGLAMWAWLVWRSRRRRPLNVIEGEYRDVTHLESLEGRGERPL